MRLTRVRTTAAMAVASVVAVLALATIWRASAAKISPTPEELAERFHVFTGGAAAGPSIQVIKRILAMDANGDTYVARKELPDRMQSLVEHGIRTAMDGSRPMKCERW